MIHDLKEKHTYSIHNLPFHYIMTTIEVQNQDTMDERVFPFTLSQMFPLPPSYNCGHKLIQTLGELVGITYYINPKAIGLIYY
jgi:hypothetical protein